MLDRLNVVCCIKKKKKTYFKSEPTSISCLMKSRGHIIRCPLIEDPLRGSSCPPQTRKDPRFLPYSFPPLALEWASKGPEKENQGGKGLGNATCCSYCWGEIRKDPCWFNRAEDNLMWRAYHGWWMLVKGSESWSGKHQQAGCSSFGLYLPCLREVFPTDEYIYKSYTREDPFCRLLGCHISYTWQGQKLLSNNSSLFQKLFSRQSTVLLCALLLIDLIKEKTSVAGTRLISCLGTHQSVLMDPLLVPITYPAMSTERYIRRCDKTLLRFVQQMINSGSSISFVGRRAVWCLIRA